MELLTRKEWLKMLESVKQIERDSDYLYFRRRDVALRIKLEAKRIKQQIESVIGQQE